MKTPLRGFRDVLRAPSPPPNGHRLLHWLGGEGNVRKIVILAFMAEYFLVAEAAFDDLNRFPGSAVHFARRDSEGMEFLPLGAYADAEIEAPAREDVRNGDVLGNTQRVVKGQAQNGCTYAQPRGLRSHCGANHDGRRSPLARAKMVLAIPGEVEAE